MSYRTVTISTNELELSGGGSVYSEEVGGDNYGDSVFFAGRRGLRDEVNWHDVASWLDDFQRWTCDADYELDCECNGDDSAVDWDAPADTDTLWNDLPSEREV